MDRLDALKLVGVITAALLFLSITSSSGGESIVRFLTLAVIVGCCVAVGLWIGLAAKPDNEPVKNPLTELHLDEVKAKHDALPRPQSVSSKRNQSIASLLIIGLIALRVLAGIARATSKSAPVFYVTLTAVLLLLLYLGYRTYKVIRASRTEPSTQQD